jgi:hypothetical protein
MYTVVVIDGRANGLPILDSPVLLTDCSGQCQSPREKSRMATFVSIVPGFSPLPEQTADCLGKSSLRASRSAEANGAGGIQERSRRLN